MTEQEFWDEVYLRCLTAYSDNSLFLHLKACATDAAKAADAALKQRRQRKIEKGVVFHWGRPGDEKTPCTEIEWVWARREIEAYERYTTADVKKRVGDRLSEFTPKVEDEGEAIKFERYDTLSAAGEEKVHRGTGTICYACKKKKVCRIQPVRGVDGGQRCMSWSMDATVDYGQETCATCRHMARPSHFEPCAACEDASHWEANVSKQQRTEGDVKTTIEEGEVVADKRDGAAQCHVCGDLRLVREGRCTHCDNILFFKERG